MIWFSLRLCGFFQIILYLPKVFQYSPKNKRVLLKPRCVVFFIIFSNTGGLNWYSHIIVDDIYYEFTKSPERLRVLPQSYWYKDCQTHVSRKEKKYGKRSLDEQVEPNLNIFEDENQRGKISKSQQEIF